MKKGFIAMGAAAVIAAGGIAAGLAGAQAPLSLWLRNDYEVPLETQPYIENGRTLVPAIELCQELRWGATGDIDDDTLSIYSGRYVIDITPGKTEAKLYDYQTDESKTLDIDVPATFDGKTYMVPVRALCEAFDIAVEWDGENNRVILDTEPDELDTAEEEYSEDAVLDGLNVNDDDYDGFEDFDFSDPQYDDVSEEVVK